MARRVHKGKIRVIILSIITDTCKYSPFSLSYSPFSLFFFPFISLVFLPDPQELESYRCSYSKKKRPRGIVNIIITMVDVVIDHCCFGLFLLFHLLVIILLLLTGRKIEWAQKVWDKLRDVGMMVVSLSLSFLSPLSLIIVIVIIIRWGFHVWLCPFYSDFFLLFVR